MSKFVIAALAVAIVACNNEPLQDGYQPGDGLNMATDGLQRLNEAIGRYCNTAQDDPARRVALAIIRVRYPDIPEDGICTGLPAEH